MKIVAGDQSKLKNLRKLISVLLFIPKVILMGNLFCHKWEKNLTRQRANREGTISRILSYEDTTMPFLQQLQYPHRKLLQTNLNIINKEYIFSSSDWSRYLSWAFFKTFLCFFNNIQLFNIYKNKIIQRIYSKHCLGLLCTLKKIVFPYQYYQEFI